MNKPKPYKLLRKYTDGSFSEIVHLKEGEYVRQIGTTKDKRVWGPNTTVIITHHRDGSRAMVEYATDAYLQGTFQQPGNVRHAKAAR